MSAASPAIVMERPISFARDVGRSRLGSSPVGGAIHCPRVGGDCQYRARKWKHLKCRRGTMLPHREGEAADAARVAAREWRPSIASSAIGYWSPCQRMPPRSSAGRSARRPHHAVRHTALVTQPAQVCRRGGYPARPPAWRRDHRPPSGAPLFPRPRITGPVHAGRYCRGRCCRPDSREGHGSVAPSSR